jgi:hypothetical protein
MKVVFTEEQIKNLLVFLSRTELKGAEVEAFVQIVTQLQKAEKDEK